jgi:hypothetical protein
MLGAFDARHARMEPCLVLARIEMAPAALDMVIQRRNRVALRAGEGRPRSLLEPDVHRFGGVIELHA